MSSNFQPSENTFDDVEGHSLMSRIVEDENDTDDVEGHGVSSSRLGGQDIGGRS